MTDRSGRRAALVATDKRHVWHPYTPMKRYVEEVDPFVIERAEGPYLFDVDGRRYLDGNCSWWVAALGHNHPRLVAALVEQAQRMCHVSLAGTTHAPATELAAALVGVAPPGLTRVFYTDDGSTALEAAIKMALGYHAHRGAPERRRFLALGGAFHGDTLGVTALGGVELFRRPFQAVLMDALFAEPPRDEADLERAVASLEALVAAHAHELAALVIEPVVQGAIGMHVYPAAYVAAARRIADAHGLLLVADEVFTGYGRTGRMWAVEHAGVTPDLLCTAKGFTGGLLPMAATLATEAVFDAFSGGPERALYYGHSFCGNPLGARVALEVLAVFRDEEVLAGIAPRAARIEAAFTRMAALAGTSRPRAIGMIGAIDLAEGAGYLGGAGWRAFEEARRLGAYLRPLGDVVYVVPPLNIPLDALDELLDVVERSVRHAMSG